MGIIDEGIDYTHPRLPATTGRTHIAFQGTRPTSNFDVATQARTYGYGKEYTGSQIDTSSTTLRQPTSRTVRTFIVSLRQWPRPEQLPWGSHRMLT